MAVVDKLVLKDPSNTDVEYDIGASAQNVSYTDGSTPTTVKGKLDSINTNHINVNVLGSEAHGIKGVKTGTSGNEKYSIEVKDGNNWYPIESGGLPETPLSIQHGGTGNTEGYIQTGYKALSVRGVKVTIEGSNNEASADYCHAEGSNNKAGRDNAHVEGRYSVASGTSSHAEGESTIAGGRATHAEGGNTTASGDYSHAGGYYTEAKGAGSFVHGRGESAYLLGRGRSEGEIDVAASFIIGDALHNKFENTRESGQTQNAPGFTFGILGKDDADSSTETSPRDGFYGQSGIIDRGTEQYMYLAPFGIYLLFAYVIDEQAGPNLDPTKTHHGMQMITTPALGEKSGIVGMKGYGAFKITPVINYDGSNFTVAPKDNQSDQDDPVLKIANENSDGLAQIRLIRIA